MTKVKRLSANPALPRRVGSVSTLTGELHHLLGDLIVSYHNITFLDSTPKISKTCLLYFIRIPNEFKLFSCPRKFVPAGNRCYSGAAPFDRTAEAAYLWY